jgi:hypothetical protein
MPELSPARPPFPWTLVRALLLALILFYVGRELLHQRDALRATAATLAIRWDLIALASGLVLLTYAALIQSWRMLVEGWGSRLSYPDAIRIWTVANLGRYLPGKIWSVGALAVLAKERGANPLAATGAALLGTLINLGAGFGVVALTGPAVLDVLGDGYRAVAGVGAGLFVVGLAALPWLIPPALGALARRRPGLSLPDRDLAPTLVWGAALINATSWVGYGLAFAMLAHAVLPSVSGALPAFVAIWTASYLVGYLVLVAPGGIGAREWALTAALVAFGITGTAEATVLAIVSRLWLTVLEVLPGLVSLALAPAARPPRG